MTGSTSGPLRIAHLSDPHFGAHSAAVAVALAEDVRAAQPALTVLTGDLTMRARPAEFRQARAFLDGLPQPTLVVLGNHDVPLLNLVARFAHPYRGYRRHVLTRLEPILDLPGVRLLGLNSMPPWRWKSGHVSPGQCELVCDAFGDAAPQAVRILALHHPVSSDGLARLAGRRRLLAALDQARVDLVLAGHTHLPATSRTRLTNGWLVEAIAGTACSTRIRGTGNSWTLLMVTRDTVTFEHRYHRATGWYAGASITYPLLRGASRPAGEAVSGEHPVA